MTEFCKTVNVKPWGADQGAFVVINAADFDTAVHELHEPAPEAEPAARKPRAKKAEPAATATADPLNG